MDLRPGEQGLVSVQENRQIRLMTEGLIAVLSIAAGVVFNLMFLGGGGGGLPALLIIALCLSPIFVMAWRRAQTRALLTDQRVIVTIGDADPHSLEYRDIRTLRVWLATLMLSGPNGTTLSLPNMRELYLLEAMIRDRMPR